MLPKNVFEQLTRASGIRCEQKASERRTSPRIPVRVTATSHRMEMGKVGPPMAVRVKDISMTGASMLTVGRSQFGGEFLLRIQAPSSSDNVFGSVWLWCLLRRQSEYDRTCTVTCVVFLKMLKPGQALVAGKDFTKMEWLDVEGDGVTPPGEKAA